VLLLSGFLADRTNGRSVASVVVVSLSVRNSLWLNGAS